MTRSPTGRRRRTALSTPLNTFYAPGGAKTDYSYAIDQLQAAHPECTTVSLVCAWFCDSLDGRDLPHLSLDHISSADRSRRRGSAWVADDWRVSSLTQNFSRPHRDADAGGRELRLWRHAIRPKRRALHP